MILTKGCWHIHWGEVDGRWVSDTEEHFLWRRCKPGPHSQTHVPTDSAWGYTGGGLLSITINTELRGKNRAISPTFLSKRVGSQGLVAAVPLLRDPGPGPTPPLMCSRPSYRQTFMLHLFCHTKILASCLPCRKSGKFLALLGLFNTASQLPGSHTAI